jgi:hypothetical protein
VKRRNDGQISKAPRRLAMDKRKERVVKLAMKLCAAGKGFCFKDDLTISDVNIAKRLERACAALAQRKK